MKQVPETQDRARAKRLQEKERGDRRVWPGERLRHGSGMKGGRGQEEEGFKVD